MQSLKGCVHQKKLLTLPRHILCNLSTNNCKRVQPWWHHRKAIENGSIRRRNCWVQPIDFEGRVKSGPTFWRCSNYRLMPHESCKQFHWKPTLRHFCINHQQLWHCITKQARADLNSQTQHQEKAETTIWFLTLSTVIKQLWIPVTSVLASYGLYWIP